MSTKEKRTIANMITGALVLAAYCIYAFGRYQTGQVAQDELKFWATSILIFIGIGIVAAIVIQIIFHILLSISIAVQEKVRDQSWDGQDIEKSINTEIVEDEMDKLIELKSNRIGFFVAGIGFVISLISIILDYPPFVMLNIVYLSFFIGSIAEGGAQLYYYRRGI